MDLEDEAENADGSLNCFNSVPCITLISQRMLNASAAVNVVDCERVVVDERNHLASSTHRSSAGAREK